MLRTCIIAGSMSLILALNIGCHASDEPDVKKCESGDAISCYRLGNMYGNSDDPQNQLKGVSYSRKACDMGYVGGCSNLGSAYSVGRGVKVDFSKAVDFYRKACEMGDVKSCDSASVEVLRSLYDEKAAAVEKARTACKNGDADGCNALAGAYKTGNGIQVDLLKAATFYDRACDLGQPGGCISLGFMYKSGKGLKKDAVKEIQSYRRATSLYIKGCNSRDGQSCNVLGNMSESGGFGGDKDIQKAVAFYQKGCDLGHAGACANSSRLASTLAKAQDYVDETFEVVTAPHVARIRVDGKDYGDSPAKINLRRMWVSDDYPPGNRTIDPVTIEAYPTGDGLCVQSGVYGENNGKIAAVIKFDMTKCANAGK